MAEIDPILQAAIDRGTALPIGTPQTGHIVGCEAGVGEAASNYLQPGTFGSMTTEYTEEAD